MSADSPRVAWVDAARGLGIVLVVSGHVLIGLIDAGVLPRSGGWWLAYYVIYAFHMPLFFWLAGLFALRSLARPVDQVATQWWWRLVWPYLLWSTLQWAVLGLAGSWANHAAELSLTRWVALLWRPISQFWFLQTLLLLQVLAWWAWPRLGPQRLLWLCLTLLLLPTLLPMPVGLTNVCRFGVFFVLGLLQAQGQPQPDWPRPGWTLWGVTGLALGVCAWVPTQVMQRGDLPWHPSALPAACAGIWLCVLLARSLPAGLQAGLAHLGRQTMPIFLLHIFFVAGVRIVLMRLGPPPPAVMLLLALLAGLLAPLAVQALARRLGGSRLWGLGA